MKKKITVDVSEECGGEGLITTKTEEFQFVNAIWDDIKDDVFMQQPPVEVNISSPNFEFIFREGKHENT